MKKILEIIFIGIILISTITLTILSYIPHNSEIIDSLPSSSLDNYITITIEGEINTDRLELRIPKGQTYRYIINSIKDSYLNDYSKLDDNYSKRYFESTTIIIDTQDTYSINKEEINKDLPISPSYPTSLPAKININNATYYELISLYGIGEKRANSILEYLNNNNTFTSFQELKKFLGVSDEVINRIQEQAILKWASLPCFRYNSSIIVV